MTTEKRDVTLFKITLSDDELKTLDDARKVLNDIFSESRARDTITHIAHAINNLEDLIEEINENDGIIEVLNREDM